MNTVIIYIYLFFFFYTVSTHIDLPGSIKCLNCFFFGINKSKKEEGMLRILLVPASRASLKG